MAALLAYSKNKLGVYWTTNKLYLHTDGKISLHKTVHKDNILLSPEDSCANFQQKSSVVSFKKTSKTVPTQLR